VLLDVPLEPVLLSELEVVAPELEVLRHSCYDQLTQLATAVVQDEPPPGYPPVSVPLASGSESRMAARDTF
jgi:hypothetical protein